MPADQYLVAVLKPLSPEQFAYASCRRPARPTRNGWRWARTADRGRQLDAQASRRSCRRSFACSAASPARPEDSFAATLDQTLFLKYGAAVRGYVHARPGNLTDRLSKLTDADAVADELFLSVLTRRPTADEKKDVADCLKDAEGPADRDRRTGLGAGGVGRVSVQSLIVKPAPAELA